jgi:ABC-type transport system involved in multi-copper enzyme maturation permease subunit
MFFWKCFRDTRSYFLVFLIAGMAIVPLSIPILGRGSISEAGLIDVVSVMAHVLAIVAAFGLATQAAGEEFAESSIHFLFTKPRTRTQFLWIAWSVGGLELLAVIAGTVLSGWIALGRLLTSSAWSALFNLIGSRSMAEHLVSALMLYCLAYALTALFRNGRTGLGSSLLLVIGIQAMSVTLRLRWHIHVPLPPEAIGHLPWALSAAIWGLVALALIAAAQLFLEKAEV